MPLIINACMFEFSMKLGIQGYTRLESEWRRQRSQVSGGGGHHLQAARRLYYRLRCPAHHGPETEHAGVCLLPLGRSSGEGARSKGREQAHQSTDRAADGPESMQRQARPVCSNYEEKGTARVVCPMRWVPQPSSQLHSILTRT